MLLQNVDFADRTLGFAGAFAAGPDPVSAERRRDSAGAQGSSFCPAHLPCREVPSSGTGLGDISHPYVQLWDLTLHARPFLGRER